MFSSSWVKAPPAIMSPPMKARQHDVKERPNPREAKSARPFSSNHVYVSIFNQ